MEVGCEWLVGGAAAGRNFAAGRGNEEKEHYFV